MRFQSLGFKALPILFALCFFCFNKIEAQITPGVADKILAVVGKNRIVLLSEFELQVAQASNTIGTLNDSLRCQLLQQMLTKKVLAEQAERDSLLVGEEELNAILDQRIRQFVQMYGSKEELEKQQGKTIYQLKEENREAFREEKMAQRMQEKLMTNIAITPAEVAIFFNQQDKDSLPYFPAAVEIGQVVIVPEPSEELDKYAKDKLEKIRLEILSGTTDFETQAGLNSMDPGSRDQGGRINGVTRNGDLVQEFITNAFRLQKPGDISPVFKTQFGYHIMQLIVRKGEEVDVRHILIIPSRTSQDYKKALLTLDSARAGLISGKISFSEAVAKYSNDENSKMTGGILTNNQTGSANLAIDQLDPQMVLLLDSMTVGTYSQPQLFNGAGRQGNEQGARIVYLKSRSEPHRANLKDDYSRIQQVALEQKKSEKMNEWMVDHLPTFYLRVADEFKNCQSLKSWITASSKGE